MELELKRQLIHILLGTIFVLSLYFLGLNLTFSLAVIVLGLGIILSALISSGTNIPIAKPILDLVERDHERHFPGRGGIFFVLGIMIPLVIGLLGLIDQRIVLGALIVLVYGDGVATLIGKKFGKIQIEDRTLEGTIAGIIVSFALLLPFFPGIVAFNGALMGMIAEYLPVDDNFTIPVVTALALSLSL